MSWWSDDLHGNMELVWDHEIIEVMLRMDGGVGYRDTLYYIPSMYLTNVLSLYQDRLAYDTSIQSLSSVLYVFIASLLF